MIDDWNRSQSEVIEKINRIFRSTAWSIGKFELIEIAGERYRDEVTDNGSPRIYLEVFKMDCTIFILGHEGGSLWRENHYKIGPKIGLDWVRS